MKKLYALVVVALFAITHVPGAAADDARVPPTARCPHWWRTAESVGWSRAELEMLDRIIWRESRCRPLVENLKDPWGGSVGLTQINRGWVRWLRELGVIRHSSDLYEPTRNLAAARAIYEYSCDTHGECWIAWGIRSV